MCLFWCVSFVYSESECTVSLCPPLHERPDKLTPTDRSDDHGWLWSQRRLLGGRSLLQLHSAESAIEKKKIIRTLPTPPYRVQHKAVHTHLQRCCNLLIMLLLLLSMVVRRWTLLSSHTVAWQNCFPASAGSKLISFCLQPCPWPMVNRQLHSEDIKPTDTPRSQMTGEPTEHQHSPAHTRRHPAVCSRGPWDRRTLHKRGTELGL